MTPLRALLALALAAVLAPVAHAQPQPLTPTQQAAIKLGTRVETLRQQLRVRPTLVIVPDAPSFIRMIERWSIAERFPILIDDGTDEARENIARFVRAFKPKNVLRWSAPDDQRAAAWPEPRDERRKAIDTAVAQAWEQPDQDALKAYWNQLGFAPPGIVLASTDDTAWPAALTLAAAHGQPIVWTDGRTGDPSVSMTTEALNQLQGIISASLTTLARPYNALGDEIDAITLCLNLPSKVPGPPEARGDIALTDVIGRDDTGARFAWAAMLIGNETQSAYRAMSAVFTRPSRAWLFDGYAADFAPPFAAANARPLFDAANFPAEIDSPPAGGLSAWRDRTRLGVTANLIHVNTSGFAYWFDLTPGRATPADVPILWEPALVHFVHSFSAQYVADPHSLAGRWLARGAYAYVGSMEEPTLGAFNPPAVFFSRMFALLPLAAAARIDDAPPWRINIFGDPLITMAKPIARHDDPLTLDGATDVEAQMRTDLRDMRLTQGLTALALLGRDAQVTALSAAALRENNPAFDQHAARVAVPSLFRAGDVQTFTLAYDRMAAGPRRDRLNADMLWQLGRPAVIPSATLPKDVDARLVSLMRLNIRDPLLVEDGAALAPAVRRVFGDVGIQSMLSELLIRARDEDTRRRLNDALGRR